MFYIHSKHIPRQDILQPGNTTHYILITHKLLIVTPEYATLYLLRGGTRVMGTEWFRDYPLYKYKIERGLM